MDKKTFAFKLAEKSQKHDKWKAREGVSRAGCTDPQDVGNYRYGDNGVWC